MGHLYEETLTIIVTHSWGTSVRSWFTRDVSGNARLTLFGKTTEYGLKCFFPQEYIIWPYSDIPVSNLSATIYKCAQEKHTMILLEAPPIDRRKPLQRFERTLVAILLSARWGKTTPPIQKYCIRILSLRYILFLWNLLLCHFSWG